MVFSCWGASPYIQNFGPVPVSNKLATIESAFNVLPTEIRPGEAGLQNNNATSCESWYCSNVEQDPCRGENRIGVFAIATGSFTESILDDRVWTLPLSVCLTLHYFLRVTSEMTSSGGQSISARVPVWISFASGFWWTDDCRPYAVKIMSNFTLLSFKWAASSMTITKERLSVENVKSSLLYLWLLPGHTFNKNASWCVRLGNNIIQGSHFEQIVNSFAVGSGLTFLSRLMPLQFVCKEA